jgi:hypothetical protein
MQEKINSISVLSLLWFEIYVYFGVKFTISNWYLIIPFICFSFGIFIHRNSLLLSMKYKMDIFPSSLMQHTWIVQYILLQRVAKKNHWSLIISCLWRVRFHRLEITIFKGTISTLIFPQRTPTVIRARPSWLKGGNSFVYNYF